jgi:putative ABC transport system permease protein
MRVGLRFFWRDIVSGQLNLIALAVIIAVTSLTTISFFTARVQQALNQQANQLLGADLVISSERVISPALIEQVQQRHLAHLQVLRFPSMALHAERNQLVDIKVVPQAYPLRGELRIAKTRLGTDQLANSIPISGQVWVDDRLLSQLQVSVGEKISLGEREFLISAVITQEPDQGAGFFNASARVMMNEKDLASTGLVKLGSRVRYRLMMNGPEAEITDFRLWWESHKTLGERIEGVKEARPEIRSALEKAELFLSIAALLSVVLSATAIGLSARRFLQRHLDSCALLRCLGTTQAQLIRIYLLQLTSLGVLASGVGCLLAFFLQTFLAYWLGSLVMIDLPAPSLLPCIQGMGIGTVLVLSFALPPILALARVPAMRVLRRDLGVPDARGWTGYLLGFLCVAGLFFWKAGHWRLGLYILVGFSVTLLLAGLLTGLLLRGLQWMARQGFQWRMGVANLTRRPFATIVQVIAFGLGLMALLSLTLVRNELLATWQLHLPSNAPNWFLTGIQTDQSEALKQFFVSQKMPTPELLPMIKARLIRINQHAVSSADYEDESARRLVEREFNLSFRQEAPSDNLLVQGAWWSEQAATASDELSIEEGVAQKLHIRLQDRLSFDIAGNNITATVTSIRKVNWDNFKVNFFVIGTPHLLEKQPANYILSFYLPLEQSAFLNQLIQRFPNVVAFDVRDLLNQVKKIISQVSSAIQFVFMFSLLAGLVVFYATVASSQEERLQQLAVLRTLGASRSQLVRMQLTEFAVLGFLAGLMGVAGASALGYWLAEKILNLPYHFSFSMMITGVGIGTVVVSAAGYWAVRRVLKMPPAEILRALY